MLGAMTTPTDAPTRRIVVFADPEGGPPPDEAVLASLRAHGSVEVHTEPPATPEDRLAAALGAEVIVNAAPMVWGYRLLSRLPGLRMISLSSVGTDMVNLEAARELGITVAHQGGNTAPIVAEHELALLLAAAKRLGFHTAELRAGRWTRRETVYLAGKRLGVIGTGNTGARMAQLGRAIGMEVVAWSFHPSEEKARALGLRYVELDELLASSDAVTLHVASSEETRGLIGREQLARMKRGAILVNGSRGAVVDTDALVEALASGQIGSAGLDVYDPEPLPADHPLRASEQVVLSPHIADNNPEGHAFMFNDAVANAVAFLDGRPQNVVT
jgi:D-3-phosphoglycerate dehydrogenase